MDSKHNIVGDGSPTFIALYYTNTPPNASIGKKNTNRGFTKPPMNLQERAQFAKNENRKI
jgi:hypothetical protein